MSAAAREHNAAFETLLAETSVLFDQDTLSSEEVDELRALIAKAEEAQEAAQAKVAAREAEEAKKAAVLQAERDAVTAAAAERARLQGELRRRSDEAEQRRLRGLSDAWTASIDWEAWVEGVKNDYLVLMDTLTDPLARAMAVFEDRLGIPTPSRDLWRAGSHSLEWEVPICGGALLCVVRLLSENNVLNPTGDLHEEVVLMSGSVQLPSSAPVIFLSHKGIFGRVLRESPAVVEAMLKAAQR